MITLIYIILRLMRLGMITLIYIILRLMRLGMITIIYIILRLIRLGKLAVVSAMSRTEIQHALFGDIILCKTTFKRLDIIFARILQSIFNNDLICY
jgi:hypothetical protein